MWDEWVVDVTLDVMNRDGEMWKTEVFCFIPYEEDTGALVTGMNLITDWPEKTQCKRVVGMVHMDGQEALEKWIEDYPGRYSILLERGLKAAK